MTNLINLILFFGTAGPLVNYIGRDDRTNAVRFVSLVICQTMRFESVIRTNGTFVLQIAQSVKGDGWETFGAPITGPTPGTNYQTWPVPKGEGYFRLVQVK